MISSTTAFPPFSSKSATITFAPSSANSNAVSLPMPLAEPVIIVTLFSNLFIFFVLIVSCFIGERYSKSCRYFLGGRHCGLLRSEEHTSELQSRPHLVCRLLLEKKNKIK